MGKQTTLQRAVTKAVIGMAVLALANFIRVPGAGAQAGFVVAAVLVALAVVNLRFGFLVSVVMAAIGGALASWLAALLLPIPHPRWSPPDGYDCYFSAFLSYGTVAGVATCLFCQGFRWPRSRRHTPNSFRFSTQQMLVVFTALGVLLACASMRIHQRRRAEDLATLWAPVGVTFTFDYWHRPKSAWTTETNQLDDDSLAELSKLKSLRSLSLTTSKVTDSGLAHVSNLTSLEQLMLGALPITDAGLAHLTANPLLREVDLLFTKVTVDGVLRLSERSNLDCVRIHSTVAESVDSVLSPPPEIVETMIAFNY